MPARLRVGFLTSEERNEARATGRSILREARRSCGFRAPVSGAVCHLRTCIFPVIYRWQADAAGGAPARAPAAFSLHLQRRGRPDRLCLAGIARAGRMPIGADLGYHGGVGGLQRRIAREITPHPALRSPDQVRRRSGFPPHHSPSSVAQERDLASRGGRGTPSAGNNPSPRSGGEGGPSEAEGRVGVLKLAPMGKMPAVPVLSDRGRPRPHGAGLTGERSGEVRREPRTGRPRSDRLLLSGCRPRSAAPERRCSSASRRRRPYSAQGRASCISTSSRIAGPA